MSSDDPFGSGGDPDGWGTEPQPPPQDPNIDMNYGQPLQPQGQMQPTPGTEMQPTKGKLENEDIIAIILTFFIPGVGHMMLGQAKKGIAILVAVFVTCGMGYIATIVFAVDAYLVAMTRKYRQVDDWEVFPDMNKHLGSG